MGRPREARDLEPNGKGGVAVELDAPKTFCCGIPIVWMRCPKAKEDVWAGFCAWCRRIFAYTNPPLAK